jgi:hypothetical protein
LSILSLSLSTTSSSKNKEMNVIVSLYVAICLNALSFHI